jgi:MASE7 protein
MYDSFKKTLIIRENCVAMVRFRVNLGADTLLEIAISERSSESPRSSAVLRLWAESHAAIRTFVAHPDPLAEASNWVALTIGSHLPFWPLYVLWAAGPHALPSSLLTASMTPLFLAVPMISRRSSLIGRLATPVLGIINTIFTIWILGMNSETEVFLVPCAALAALIFRRRERLLMLGLTLLPLIVWYLLQHLPITPLHQYNTSVAHELAVLNVCSIGVLIVLFGWFQVDIYRKMEARENGQ